jgi:large subunit ribosomal protein L18
MSRTKQFRVARLRRHARVRLRVSGTADRPRLVVHRGVRNISAQIIDDSKGCTLASAASFDKKLKPSVKNGGNVAAAKTVGEQIAKLAKEKSISRVVFDRGGYAYHGRVKALAESAREHGLQF